MQSTHAKMAQQIWEAAADSTMGDGLDWLSSRVLPQALEILNERTTTLRMSVAEAASVQVALLRLAADNIEEEIPHR